MRELILSHGKIELPAFFPDATRGAVRCVDSADLERCGVRGLVMNTYHLSNKPGVSTIKANGGLHGFAAWKRPIITDSGGFQVFSLIRENPSFGEIRDNEIIFRIEGKKTTLTPEKCIRSQAAYGSDVFMCLDYCTHPDDGLETQKHAVETTVRWAKRCKDEFTKIVSSQKKFETNKPMIFGIIQGGNEKNLRRECADALKEIGFDGYGFGGWPLDGEGRLTEEILSYTAELMPDETVKYAMGVGKPENIVACYKMDYDLFDCVAPTREARNNRLYVFNEDFESTFEIDLHEKNYYSFHYILDDAHRRDARPVSKICDCFTCENYSRAYLRHLSSVGDSLGARLATIHNLRFYTMLTERLRGTRDG